MVSLAEKQQLKTGWKVWRFDQIAINVNDRIDDPSKAEVDYYVGLEHLDSDSLKIRRWGSPSDVEATKLIFRKGDIIFGRRRVYQRKVAVAEFDGICSAHALVLRARPEVTLPEFLPFFMQSDLFMERAKSISVGSLSPTINWKTLAKEEFSLPPLEEQKRFLELLLCLERTFNHYVEASDRIEKLLLSRTEGFLSDLDSDSLSCPVESLLSESPRNGVSPKTNDSSQGYRTVSISSIIAGQFITDGNIKYAEISHEKVEQFLVKEKDVFVIRGNGNRQLTAKCGISTETYQNLFYPDLLIRLRFNETKIISKFAVLQWNAPSAHRRLISRAKSTNGIWKINGQDIRKHKLLVPSIKDQKNLLAETESILGTLKSLRIRIGQLKRFKSTILNIHLAGAE